MFLPLNAFLRVWFGGSTRLRRQQKGFLFLSFLLFLFSLCLSFPFWLHNARMTNPPLNRFDFHDTAGWNGCWPGEGFRSPFFTTIRSWQIYPTKRGRERSEGGGSAFQPRPTHHHHGVGEARCFPTFGTVVYRLPSDERAGTWR